MPAQELGIKDDKVKVIAVDSVTGAIITSVNHSDNSSTGDSVDGNLPADSVTNLKDLQSINFNLDNQNSDGSISFASHISSGSSNTISTIDSTTVKVTSNQSQNIQTSNSAVSVPQVIIVDSNERNSLLGKRPADGLAQNSLVNKIIITKNSSASQGFPVHLQTINASQGVSFQSGVNATVVSHNPQTPTKTITISQQGIVSPVKGITMAQVAGTPPKLPISKLPISPAKTPTKITMIPVPGRSPQRIAPAGLTSLGNSILTNSNSSHATITMSPSKIIKQPGTVHVIQKPIQPSALSGATVMTIPRQGTSATQAVRHVTLPSNLQQIHVPGNKFHYIRLANPSSSAGTRTQILPASVAQSQQPVKITLPAQATQLLQSRPTGTSGTVQRIILPAAPNQVSIRPAPNTSTATGPQIIRTTLAAGTTNLQQLTSGSGATFLSTGGSGPQGVQGFALVPASYLSQIQQQIQVKPVVTTATIATVTTTASTTQSRSSQDYITIAPNNPVATSTTNKNVNGSSVDGSARQRKPCNCTKSQCLKLYCDCFANGEFCHNCNCTNCANNLEHEEDRSRAIKQCLERNPLAFHPKIGKGRAGEKDRRHNKGCNCKRSGCLKNYCECYEAKIMCSSSCKCVGCKNFEESPERKTLMHLADAAEVRVLQQTAAKTKLSSQISDLPSRPVSSVTGERLPFSFVTSDVVEATCSCLLAQAEEADRQAMPPVVQERMVIEEFGRCLLQIIESANRTKAPDPDDTG